MSLETLGLENISQVSPYRAEDPQNYNVHNGLPPTLSVLKRSRAIFRPASSKGSVQKVILCPFNRKPSPSAVSLESPGLEYIPQVPETEPNLVKITMHVSRSGLFYQS